MPYRPRDGGRSWRVAQRRRWVVALAGLVGATAPVMQVVTPVAHDVAAAQPAAASAVVRLALGTDQAAGAATDVASHNSGDPSAGPVPLSLTLPESGYFTVTVAPGTVTLSALGKAPYATGMLPDITVTESRNDVPGWSATGQATELTAGGQATATSQLGWVPTGAVVGGASLGVPVAPGNPGLGSPALLASAGVGSGFGSDTLSAMLLLQIPAGAQGGPFGGTLTITFVEAGPQPEPVESPSLLPPAH